MAKSYHAPTRKQTPAPRRSDFDYITPLSDKSVGNVGQTTPAQQKESRAKEHNSKRPYSGLADYADQQGAPESAQVFRCGLSTAFLNKENLTGKRSALGYSFKPSGVQDAQFAKHVLSGRAWTPGYFKGSTRRNETFISSELIALDFDNNVSVADALSIPAVRQYAMLVHPTPSSTPDCYRTRVVFRLSEPVEGVERYRTIARAWAEYIGLDVDPASWKPAQPYYGSTNRIEQPYTNLDARLDIEFAGGLTADLATDDYLRQTTKKTYAAVDVSSPRAEKYAAATVQGAISDYLALPSGAGVRHAAFVKLAARLLAMKLGGWPCLDNVDAIIADTGRATDRTEREITDAIQWAYKTVDATPLALPDDDFTNAPAPATTHNDWFTDLPDSWRETIMNALKPCHAPIIELLFQAGKTGAINLQDFTAPDLQAANAALGFNIPHTTLYRGLDELSGDFFPLCHTIETPQETIVGHFGKNSARGRKATRYSLNPYPDVKARLIEFATPRIYERASESHEGEILMPPTSGMIQAVGVADRDAVTVAAELHVALTPAYQSQSNREQIAVKRARRSRARLVRNLDNWHSTPMPEGWPLGSAANYRAAYAHAKVAADPNTPRSRRELAEMTGIDPHSVKSLRTRAGLQAESQETQVEVQSFDDIRAYGRRHRAFAKCLVAKSANGQTETPAENETYSAFINRQRAIGAQVTAHFQHISINKIVRETPPASAERKRKEDTPVLESRPPSRATEPKPERHYGPDYDPRWIMKQLRLALKLLGWQYSDAGLVNPDTGEIAPDTPRQIIEILIGHPVTAAEHVESWDGFSELADELGSVVNISERAGA